MSVKKLLVLSAAGVATIAMTSAFAGGVDQYQAQTVPTQNNDTGLYLEANAGYAQTDINQGYTGLGNGFSFSNKNGGWTFGADVGYQFMRYLALEVGGFYLPTYKATVNSIGAQQKIKSWAGYGALKVIAPVSDQFDVFAKGGLGYLHVNDTFNPAFFTTPTTESMHNWDPMFAVGADYNFSDNLSVNATLTHFQGKSVSGVTYPSPNLWTVGVGYKFAV